jgi:hypothetical protein
MGVRILHDGLQSMAALYCSTSDVAFGPVFTDGGAPNYEDASERAEAFLRWLPQDARRYEDGRLQERYSEWLAQEQAQYLREHPETCDDCGEVVGTCDDDCPSKAKAVTR